MTSKYQYLFNILKNYGEEFGPSGFEKPVLDMFSKNVKPYVDEFISDNLGSLIAVKKGKLDSKYRVLLDAHADEIGFIINEITTHGLIKFGNLGGWWVHVLIGKKVKIYSRKLNKYIIGIIGAPPIHLLSVEQRTKLMDRDKIFIDIGASSRQEVESFGINIGDPIVKHDTSLLLSNGVYACTKSVDNRVGITILDQVLKHFANKRPNFHLYGAAVVQEEVGIRGAMTTANLVKPLIAVVIDTTVTDDTFKPLSDNDTKLNKGVAISIMDGTCICTPTLVDKFIQICQDHKIPYNLDPLTSGGTDAGSIHKSGTGVLTITISIPSRYLHTHNEVCSLADVEAAIKLITIFLEQLDEKMYHQLAKVW
ncbi:M42 family metallopeptidase [Mycoplasma sp. SG1]|uniref:M42 family metallopeptidase n=1 Tax=Mycoplasma sp. SG1 TaxID=2810348 RepID=UPI002024B7A1|nr:M42 family metallopeptidase [Mycoplasma sp. SG1]URM53193.1 M42 family metallopeptidase [Mycoplasma sp. SG1]